MEGHDTIHLYVVGGLSQTITQRIWSCSHTGQLQGIYFGRSEKLRSGLENLERLEHEVGFVIGVFNGL